MRVKWPIYYSAVVGSYFTCNLKLEGRILGKRKEMFWVKVTVSSKPKKKESKNEKKNGKSVCFSYCGDSIGF
jgi:hypothetical protein